MKKKSYKAFTLVEMLIVMGVLVILIVVGVAAGRFSIDKSNEIAHKNGATQLYQAAQSFYTDNGVFPDGSQPDGTPISIEQMTAEGGSLKNYLDLGLFNGGSEATYYYSTNTSKQAVLICVTLGGIDDELQKGIICVGNGFGDPTMGEGFGTITKEKYLPVEDPASYELIKKAKTRSNWDGRTWTPIKEEPTYDPCAPCDPTKDTNCIDGRPSYCDTDDGTDKTLEPIVKDIPSPVIPGSPDDPCSPSCVPDKDTECLDVNSPACM